MKIFRKLVRDRIPEVIASKGERAITRVLDDAEYRNALENKLIEEVQEFRSSKENPEEELADIYEVLDAIEKERGFSKESIAALQVKKRAERGGFEKKIFLERVA